MAASGFRYEATCPMGREQVIERYFLEHRAKLLDVAAFLDRVERAEGAEVEEDVQDYRIRQMYEAIALLIDGDGERARRVLELLSDPTTEPIAAAPGKGAAGAYDAQAST